MSFFTFAVSDVLKKITQTSTIAHKQLNTETIQQIHYVARPIPLLV